MSYENPDRRTYVFPLFDYGGAAGARTDRIRGPKGKTGRLIDYGVVGVQETFAGTTDATIAIGTTGDVDAYGNEFPLGTDVTTTLGSKTVQSTYDPIADAANWATYMLDQSIPADVPILITNTEAITGPAGQACPYVVIDWAD